MKILLTSNRQQNPPPDDLGAAPPELWGVEEAAWSGLAPARPMPTMAAAATPPAARYGVGKPPPAFTHQLARRHEAGHIVT